MQWYGRDEASVHGEFGCWVVGSLPPGLALGSGMAMVDAGSAVVDAGRAVVGAGPVPRDVLGGEEITGWLGDLLTAERWKKRSRKCLVRIFLGCTTSKSIWNVVWTFLETEQFSKSYTARSTLHYKVLCHPPQSGHISLTRIHPKRLATWRRLVATYGWPQSLNCQEVPQGSLHLQVWRQCTSPNDRFGYQSILQWYDADHHHHPRRQRRRWPQNSGVLRVLINMTNKPTPQVAQ